jgi:choice-of-anchor B domain-containing protein
VLRLFFAVIFYPVLFYSQNSNITLLDSWTKDSLPYCYDGESVFNEVWGFSVNGTDYGVIGSTAGAHFFDISNDQLDEVAFVAGKYVGPQAVHRDYHDYNGYLYAVCDENLSSLQIMDLSYLPDSVPLVYDSDELIVRAHNIFIDTAMAKLYVLSATSNTQFKPMSVYDISSPTNPQFLYSYENVNHVHDAYVYNDTAYLNCGSEGLKVIRSANNFPIQIGELTTYLDKGYNHSGWLNKSKNTYIMCDETYGMNIKAINVSDLNDIQTESLFNSDMGDDDNSVAHNVIVRNDIAYVSYYHDGLQIFDVSNPSNVKKLGFFDTYNNIPSVSWAGAWGVYPFRDGERILVSDRANGLFLIGFDVPQFVDIISPQEVQVFPNPAQDYICFFREHLREADYDLTIFDISGRKLRSYKSSNDFFKVNDLSHFKSGIYFLSYRSNIEAVSFKVKFIKN